MMKRSRWRKVFARFFFTGAERKALVQAIRTAESGTSAELRLRLETRRAEKPILVQAESAFQKLGMHKTAGRNGVLILLCPNTREIAVVGDRGIDSKVNSDFWKEIIEGMARDFQNDRIVEGLENTILKIGHEFKRYFPRLHNDRNELSDQIS